MGLWRTKMDENDATIFHSYRCFFLSVSPLSVAIFAGEIHHHESNHLSDIWQA